MSVILTYVEEGVVSLGETFFLCVAEETIEHCLLSNVRKKKEIFCSAIAVTPEKIRELNRTYRSKDTETDILSFGEYADMDMLEQDTRSSIHLGEIFFCPQVIAQAAQEDSVSLEHEMTYVFSHGILHLLGYDHGDIMFAIQDTVTERRVKQDASLRKTNSDKK